MKKVISIGIDRARGMTGLQGAASGAEDFGKWAQTQGYDVKIFTDSTASVSQADIFKEVKSAIGYCEQLIIFFSGHGILKGPSQELWILSDAIDNPNESINLTGSIDNARTSGIPYITFISDACRVLPAELQLTGNGSVIFPIRNDINQDSAIDIFYGTRPGSPANEISLENNKKKFGIFSECLMEGLSGKNKEVLEPEVPIEKVSEVRQMSYLIRSPRLKELLKNTVPAKAHAKSIFISQNPEIRIESQAPNYLAKYEMPLHGDELLLTINKTILSDDLIPDSATDFVTGKNEFHTKNNSSGLSPERNSLDTNTNLILNSKGRESFETQTGFTILGADVAAVAIGNNGYDLFFENNTQHIRIHDETRASALVILQSGISVPVAILKGFIGTLIFNEGHLLTVNYTPSRNSDKYWEYQSRENDINFARATVAALANEGFDYSQKFSDAFTQHGDLNYRDIGGYLRMEKSLDPSLGLYACYAYRQAGKTKDIKSVLRYMSEENKYLFFDVVMLANEMDRYAERLASFCPLMSLGWAYPNLFERHLNPGVAEASLYLIPGLWTTFSSRGTEILDHLIQNNQIK